MRGEYPQNPTPAARTFGLGPQRYVGPAVMINFGKLWWAVGGVRARHRHSATTSSPARPYGPLWFRTMIGYDL